MSWISGPCSDEPERNVASPDDDEGLMESSTHDEREQRSQPRAWGGARATHFHPYLVNQRTYPYRPRGTVRDAE